MQRDWETALLLGERNLSYLYSRALSVVVSGRWCVNALAEQTVLAECLHPPCPHAQDSAAGAGWQIRGMRQSQRSVAHGMVG